MNLFNRSHLRSFLFKLSIYVLAFALFLGVAQAQVYAVYGEGTYGSGKYGGGNTSSTTTTSSSNSGSSSSGSSSPGCSEQPPGSVPDLFQINAHKESLTLFFAPISGNRDRYVVSYGIEAGVDQHAFEFMNSENGVISVEVRDLQPNTVYYFRVRAGNGCQPGEWSNQLSAKMGQRFPAYRWSSLPQIVATGVKRRINPASVTNIDADTSTVTPSPTPSTTPTQQQRPTPTPQPAVEQEKPASSSFFSRVVNLFKGIF